MSNLRTFKCGKKPASPQKPTDLLFSKYRTGAVTLPPHGPAFGTTTLPNGQPWGMLGNDTVGDCVIAWACHFIMLVNAAAGRTVTFSTETALKNYSAATGYDPSQTDAEGNNPTDQGTDMAAFMDFWRTTGIVDDAGTYHKIAAYVRLDITNWEEILEAIYLGQMPGLGIMLPDSAMQQTQNGQPWTIVPGAKPDGGHCIGGQGFGLVDPRFIDLNTWSMNQQAAVDFMQSVLDEGFVPITQEMLNGQGVNPQGLDWAALQADLNALIGVSASPPSPSPSIWENIWQWIHHFFGDSAKVEEVRAFAVSLSSMSLTNEERREALLGKVRSLLPGVRTAVANLAVEAVNCMANAQHAEPFLPTSTTSRLIKPTAPAPRPTGGVGAINVRQK